MFLERRLDHWANTIRKDRGLPLRLDLWNGRQIHLSQEEPQVIVQIPDISALPYLLVPSLSNLGRAYVEGKINLKGNLSDIISMGNALAARLLKPEGKLSRIFRNSIHSREKSREAIHYHYDVSNDFYKHWLDKNMVYSCAYFENGNEDLDTAQTKKIDHILKKIQLHPGEKLLDIGCGWGALIMRAAQKYGASCVGITLSENQYAYVSQRIIEAGLSHKIEVRLMDYRDVTGTFDKITSVGMFEHVGLENLSTYFAKIKSLLRDDGIALNHGITTTDANNGETPYGNGAFIENYVFPQGQLPHIGTVLKSMQEGGLEALDIENLRQHYAHTCAIWAANFEKNAETIRQIAGEKRYRIWRVYLAGCAYAFRQDWISLFQIVCVKSGQSGTGFPSSRRYMYSHDNPSSASLLRPNK